MTEVLITARQMLMLARRASENCPTQEQLANELRIPYKKIERGKHIPRDSNDLKLIARKLHLTSYSAWLLLWYAFYGPGSRPQPLDPNAGPAIKGNWDKIINGQINPACLVDTDGTVLAHNPRMEALWGGRPTSIISWMLGLDTAGPGYPEDWVADGLARLQAALQQHPDDDSLLAIAEAARKAELDPALMIKPLPSERRLIHGCEHREIVVTVLETEVLYNGARILCFPYERT